MASVKTNVMPELPPLLPPPRQIEFCDGTSTLSSDVRLSTRDVLPFMRKGMRSIFTAADIRVVANKKKFVIEVHVVDGSEVELSDIPEKLRKDAYEMDIIDNLVTIRSASQPGAAWGVQTFADIYGSAGPDTEIPNVKIRDWSNTPLRGFYMPCTPALERMRYDEFTEIADRIARSKCNLVGVELFTQRYASTPEYSVVDDTLLVPLPGEEPPPPQGKHYEGIDPVSGEKEIHEGFPPLIEAQGLTKLVNYITGKGLAFMPGFAFPAKSRLLPELFPAVRGQSSTGTEAEDICCLTNSDSRQAFEELFSQLFDENFEKAPEYFLLNLNALPPLDDPRHWCQCPECKEQVPPELVTGFIKWMIETLISKGVSKVVLSQTDLAHAGQIVSEDFEKSVSDAGFTQNVLLHIGGDYKPSSLSPLTTASTSLGVGCGFDGGIEQLTQSVKKAIAQNTEGVLAITRPDAQSLLSESVMALHTWSGPITGSVEETCAYVTGSLAPRDESELNTALQKMLEAISGCDMAAALLKYHAGASEQTPSVLTDKVLRDLEAHVKDDPVAQLEKARDAAKQAADILDELIVKLTPSAEGIGEDETPPKPPQYLLSMRGETAYIRAVAGYFLQMLPYRGELRNDPPAEAVQKTLQEGSGNLREWMKEIIEFKSRCPAAEDISILSALLA
ncbi:MAG: glycoside hydrolase family 20 zincin-like fold domain-containing protein [Lentisphaeria bacterium]